LPEWLAPTAVHELHVEQWGRYKNLPIIAERNVASNSCGIDIREEGLVLEAAMRAGCREAEGEGSPISFFPFLISLVKNWYYLLFLHSRNEIILGVPYLGSFTKIVC
jgi:hypothetical protein